MDWWFGDEKTQPTTHEKKRKKTPKTQETTQKTESSTHRAALPARRFASSRLQSETLKAQLAIQAADGGVPLEEGASRKAATFHRHGLRGQRTATTWVMAPHMGLARVKMAPPKQKVRWPWACQNPSRLAPSEHPIQSNHSNRF